MNITSLSITPELLRLITEIDEFKGSWQASNNQNPERLKALKYIVTIESIGSSTRIDHTKTKCPNSSRKDVLLKNTNGNFN